MMKRTALNFHLFACFAMFFLVIVGEFGPVFADSDSDSDDDTDHEDAELAEAELEALKKEKFDELMQKMAKTGDHVAKELRMSKFIWSLEELQTLMDVLADHPEIKTVYISECGIGDEGAIIIAEMLKKNNVIRFLSLSDNVISDKGAIAIGESLVINKELRDLWLNRNKVGDEGAKALVKPIEDEKSDLRNLSMIKNKFGDEGARAMMSAWDKNPAIVGIFIEGNDVSMEMKRRAVELYEQKRNFYERGPPKVIV